MTEPTQPPTAWGKTLIAGFTATALIALLAFAPLASAASDPVASGSTTLTVNSGLFNKLKKSGVKIAKVSPAKLKGKKATFTVTGGTIDPATGIGSVTLGGGLKFKAGGKSATVKKLSLDTSKKALNGNVAGKKMKLASIKGFTTTRNGFGVKLTLKTLKLTGSAAKQLNKKLGFTGKSKSKAKGKVVQPPFKGNQVLGTGSSEVQPSTVAVKPVGNLTFAGNPTLLEKLKNVEVKVETIPPTTASANVFTSPITGGTIGPTGTAGVVQSGGGLRLVQVLPTSPTTAITTKITLAAMYVDLSAKTVSVEVVGESNAKNSEGKEPLNLGNLGRSSIADLAVTSVTPNPAALTVGVNASASLQVVAAEVLQGFVSVYRAYVEGGTTVKVCEALPGHCATQGEKEIAAAKAKEEGEKVEKNHISAGEGLGTFAFTAQGE
jgi:hypothetical protein